MMIFIQSRPLSSRWRHLNLPLAGPEVSVVKSHRIKSTFAAIILVVLFATPVGIGLVFATSPHSERTSTVIVANVSAIPADGLPHRYPVTVSHRNAWATGSPHIVGYLFLRRSQDSLGIRAFAATHSPTFNIPVSFDAQIGKFVSDCWSVEFDSDGRSLSPGFEDLQHIPVAVASDVVTVQLYSDRPTFQDLKSVGVDPDRGSGMVPPRFKSLFNGVGLRRSVR